MKSNFGRILISILIALGLYLYVITVEVPNSEDTYANIPVVLENESALDSRGLMRTSQDIPTVTLRLTGKRTELNKLSSTNLTVRADLSKIYDTGRRQLTYTVYFPEGVSQSEIDLVSSYPSMITVTIERRVEKQVPVEVDFLGAVPENYKADRENMILDYEFITASGPASIMDQVHHAKVTLDLDEKTQTIVQELVYVLCDENDQQLQIDADLVQTNVEMVHLELPIYRIMEIPLVLNVIDGGGATGDTSKIDIEPKSIMVSGSEEALEALAQSNLVLGTVNLAELKGDEAPMAFPITLPAGLTNETGVNEAKVTISFPELMTQTFTVTNISAVNVPAGMEADLVTMQLDVTVRGKKSLVSSLTADQLAVIVDMSQATVGTYSLKGTLVLPEGFETVGAMSNLTLTVTLRAVEGTG